MGKRDHRVLGEELPTILFNAVGPSKTLRCQRALWSVRQVGNPSPKGEPVLLDYAVMEYKHGEDDSDGQDIPTATGKQVEIVVNSGLFKRGILMESDLNLNLVWNG